MVVLEVESLTKRYGERPVVDGLLATAVDAYAQYSLDGASDALTSMPASAAGGGGVLAPWAGGLVLAACVAALLAVGATLLSRRDVE
jgi:hypothetical protein